MDTPSLADRMAAKPLDAASTSFTPAASWADEVASPVAKANENPLEGQTDGASEIHQGSGLHEGSYEVEVKLSDLQADASNPLYSINSFEELGINPAILKGLYALQFRKPSRIQEKALPLLLANPPRNMIAQSQSGTG